MSYATDELVPQAWVANTPTIVYTSSNGKTVIDKLTTTNTTSGALDVSVYIVASGGSAAAMTLVKTKTLSGGECYTWPEVIGKTIRLGAMLYAGTSAATSVNVGMSGRVGS